MNKLITYQEIEALLPQTQCGDCGYLGCKPYAKAIVEEGVAINRCLPGGIKTLHAIADRCSLDAKSFEAELLPKIKMPAVAKIREEECIGCTKCIQACPVDAIIGSAKLMHTVIHQECTGCGLCIEPCPMDCIDLLSLPEIQYDPNVARQRYEAKQQRQSADKLEVAVVLKQAKQDYIRQAMARVGEKKARAQG